MTRKGSRWARDYVPCLPTDEIIRTDLHGMPFSDWALHLQIDHPIRQLAIRILTWWLFEWLVLLAILINCAFMAAQDKQATRHSK